MPSTVIRSFTYHPAQSQLEITFQSGKRYVYDGVPLEVYEAMKNAFSKGEFFNEHIRDRFAFTRESSAAPGSAAPRGRTRAR
jgi:lysyl-tRNA synthetase class 2